MDHEEMRLRHQLTRDRLTAVAIDIPELRQSALALVDGMSKESMSWVKVLEQPTVKPGMPISDLSTLPPDQWEEYHNAMVAAFKATQEKRSGGQPIYDGQ